MLNIKTKNRLSIFIVISVLSIVIIIFILKTLEDNVLYFYSPSDIKESNKIVFGDGNINAKIMIIGEGPGANEDVEGSQVCKNICADFPIAPINKRMQIKLMALKFIPKNDKSFSND